MPPVGMFPIFNEPVGRSAALIKLTERSLPDLALDEDAVCPAYSSSVELAAVRTASPMYLLLQQPALDLAEDVASFGLRVIADDATLAMTSSRSGPMTSAYTNGPLDLGSLRSATIKRARWFGSRACRPTGQRAADQHRRGDDHHETNEDRPNTVVRRDARQLVKRHAERGDDRALRAR